ncbi:MAG: ABC transporter ATP-binding protein [Acidobacteriota bacterium]
MSSDDATTTKKTDFKSGLALYRRLWPYLRPERRLSIAIGALLLVAIPASVAAPLLVREIFDGALAAGDRTLLFQLGLGLVGLTLVSFGLGYIQTLLALSLHARVRFRIGARVHDQVLRLPLAFFDEQETGKLMSRLRDDLAALDVLMTDELLEAAVNVLRALVFFVLLLWLDLGLALSGLALCVVIFGGVLLVSRPLRRRSEAAREADATASSALHEALRGLTSIKLGARHRAERARLLAELKDALRAAISRDVLGLVTGSAFGLVGTLGGYVIIAVGAYRILDGSSSFGGLFAFFIFLTQLMGSAGAVFAMVPGLQAGFASWERLLTLLDRDAEDPGKPDTLPRFAGRLELQDLHFAYRREVEPEASDEDAPDDDGSGDTSSDSEEEEKKEEEVVEVLKGLDLTVEPGEVLALIGRSGAGKTTLLQLLPRLREPTAGRILLDGQPLDELPLQALRRQVGVVPQDIFLFNRSVRENLTFAMPGASDEAIISAARASRAWEFIERLPKGLDTVVGEDGVRLSGGQRQRLALAREFLRDPPLLLLDEATANLDAESEQAVREALHGLLAGRTCLVVAHRLSTIRDAHRIAVLEDGQVAELGTHDELLALGGLYALWHRQQVSSADSVDAS